MGWLEENKVEKEVKDIKSLFVPLQDSAKKRGLKVGVYGKPSSGKTHFALDFPEPVYILDTESGSQPLAKNFKDKKIFRIDVFEKGKNGEKDEVDCFEMIKQAVDWITENVKEGTVVIDSGTDLWKFAQTYGKVKIFNLSPEARLKQRFDWGKINNLYEQILSILIHSDLNLVITGKITNKYDTTGGETSETTSRWQKDTEYQLDVIIQMSQQKIKDVISFNGIIEKCRVDGKLMEEKVENLNYETLNKKLRGE
mgnify:CR=1 FL=1